MAEVGSNARREESGQVGWWVRGGRGCGGVDDGLSLVVEGGNAVAGALVVLCHHHRQDFWLTGPFYLILVDAMDRELGIVKVKSRPTFTSEVKSSLSRQK